MRILLAMDDSKFSEGALQALITQSRPQGAEVRVLHVLELMEVVLPQIGRHHPSGVYPDEPFNLDKIRQERSEAARTLVEDTCEKLRAAGFSADAALREGDPRAEIIDDAASWRADLIVLGSHGRKGLDRFLLGSVSEFVARHAPCSIEIVRLPR